MPAPRTSFMQADGIPVGVVTAENRQAEEHAALVDVAAIDEHTFAA